KSVPDLNWTHSLGAAILFLDRVGDEQDRGRIRAMGARLLAGQNKDGGWGYNCPALAEEDVAKLKNGDAFLQGVSRLAAQLQKNPRTTGVLVGGIGGVSMTENSCSEFAVMGLWVARRHQVPVTKALATYERCCRKFQNADGSFPYSTTMRMNHSTCMTCAGLLGLAFCYGSANESALLRYAKSTF